MNNIKSPSRGNAFMLLLLLFNIVVTLAVSLIYWPLADTPYGAFFDTPWFAMLAQGVSFILPLVIWLKLTGDTLSVRLPGRRLGRVNIILLLALCLCLQPAMMLLSSLSSIFFPNAVAEVLSDWHSYPLAVSMAAVALTPALCEEAVFRGYILSQYNGVPIKKAAFVTGLFFAMMHLNAQQFLYAFVMGVLFAFFVYYTRSLYASVLVHFVVNATQLLINYMVEMLMSSPAATPASGDMLSGVLYMSAIALVFLPAVLILLRAFVTHNRQRNTRLDLRTTLREPCAGGEDDEKAPLSGQRQLRVFDLFFWGAVGVYVVFMVLTNL